MSFFLAYLKWFFQMSHSCIFTGFFKCFFFQMCVCVWFHVHRRQVQPTVRAGRPGVRARLPEAHRLEGMCQANWGRTDFFRCLYPIPLALSCSGTRAGQGQGPCASFSLSRSWRSLKLLIRRKQQERFVFVFWWSDSFFWSDAFFSAESFPERSPASKRSWPRSLKAISAPMTGPNKPMADTAARVSLVSSLAHPAPKKII